MARVIFCEETSDINFILSRREAIDLKRQPHATPFLNAEQSGKAFIILNPENVRDYIHVMTPREKSLPYYLRVSDNALTDLIANGYCGTRYNGSSKVNLHLEENL